MNRLFAVLALVLGCAARLTAQTDGIFADFKTSMGSFTCRLDQAVAPKAVANFIGLATGQRAWLDLNTGLARTDPFYNGLIFHRVIKGFMNQGGSPNGKGTDGPGYAFVDEFSAAARHDAAGTLSMANSGTDSNGGQFFVTVEPTPWLNDVHTIFGRVVGGMSVVTAINNVATTNDRPVVPVVLQTVSIRRVGAAAQAFDINAQGLPVVKNLAVTATLQGTNASLALNRPAFADSRVFSSTNLSATNWTSRALGITLATPVAAPATSPATNQTEFFRVAQIQYADSTLAPPNVLTRTVILQFTGGLGTITVQFNGTGGGTYTWEHGSTSNGTITSYTWEQDVYVGRLWPVQFSGLVPMTLRMNFDNANGGAFTGTAYAANPFSVSGTFIMTAL